MRTTFSDKVTHVEVEGEESDPDSSSEGKSDHLSYSYSCVRSFRKNQHIIGDLAALHNEQDYQGTSHQPALYSLSGQRNRPFCNSLYCDPVSENSDSFEQEQVNADSREKRVLEPVNDELANTESQHQFPIKTLLLQWMKYQFKQVNTLWPLTLPKDIFIPKIFKNNKQMKMEMTLNGVDKESKQRLIEYINNINLSFEEHCNLCTGNETVFEIDVTSIIDDPKRLQCFLSFLKGLQSEKSKTLNVKSTVQPDFNENFKSRERYDVGGECRMKEKFVDKTINNMKSKLCGENTRQTSVLSLTSSESNESFRPIGKKPNNCFTQLQKQSIL